MSKSNISSALISGENYISKKICATKVVVALLLVFISIACFATAKILDIGSESALYFVLLLGGISLLIWGIVRLCVGCCDWVYQGSVLRGYTINLENSTAHDALRAIEQNDWETLGKLVVKHDSNAKIEFVLSADWLFARCSVLSYVPYKFEAISPAISLKPDEAKRLFEFAK